MTLNITFITKVHYFLLLALTIAIEVKDATLRLLHTVIPRFAHGLDTWMEGHSMKFPNKKNRAVLSDIIEDLHRRGINVRHLGYAQFFFKNRKYILIIMQLRSVQS